ncbi:MAG: hypothetical protein ACO3EE_09825 [Flavobacteriales bacterium]
MEKQSKSAKLLTAKRGLSAFFVSLILFFSACDKESDSTIDGLWKLEKYSCDAFSNYRELTFFFDTTATSSDSAWYIDPLVLDDTVFVKYAISGSELKITDAKNAWNGTFPFKFSSARLIEITRAGSKCGEERYTFYK